MSQTIETKRGRGRPKYSDRDDVTVRVDRITVSRAKLIASYRGITVADLLTEMVQAPITQAYGQLLREVGK